MKQPKKYLKLFLEIGVRFIRITRETTPNLNAEFGSQPAVCGVTVPATPHGGFFYTSDLSVLETKHPDTGR
jgi:hypothetical protein